MEGTKTVDTLATLMLTGSTTHQTTKTPEVHAVEVDVDAYEDILATFEVHNVRKQSNDILWVDLDVDGKPPRWNWTQTSTSRKLTGFACTKLDCP